LEERLYRLRGAHSRDPKEESRLLIIIIMGVFCMNLELPTIATLRGMGAQAGRLTTC
jgi:hypothetical protein